MAQDLPDTGSRELSLAGALEHVPGFAAGDAVTRMPGGSLNRTYAVSTQAGEFVVRLTPATDAWLTTDRSVERALQAAAAQAGLAPRLLCADANDRWSICELVAGDPWTARELADPECLGRLGDVLRRLHELPPPDCGRFDLPSALAAYEDRLALASDPNLPLIHAWVQHAAEAWLASGAARRPATVVHHDLNAANIIAGPGGLVLIDWECAAVCDPLLDVACVLSYYDSALEHADRLLEHSGLATVERIQWQAAVWLFDLHTLLWYWERRYRIAPTAAEEQAAARLAARVNESHAFRSL